MVIRTCVACGVKCEKNQLERYVWDGEKPSLDAKYVAVGRGAYCCRNEVCYGRFMKNSKKWGRVFKL